MMCWEKTVRLEQPFIKPCRRCDSFWYAYVKEIAHTWHYEASTWMSLRQAVAITHVEHMFLLDAPFSFDFCVALLHSSGNLV